MPEIELEMFSPPAAFCKDVTRAIGERGNLTNGIQFGWLGASSVSAPSASNFLGAFSRGDLLELRRHQCISAEALVALVVDVPEESHQFLVLAVSKAGLSSISLERVCDLRVSNVTFKLPQLNESANAEVAKLLELVGLKPKNETENRVTDK